MSEPPFPYPAATVILLRDTAEGVEVFLMQRNIKSSAFAGMYVFPGGRVDEDDQSAVLYERCDLSDKDASRILGIENNGLAYYIAAVRECFEESGVLLAGNQAVYDVDELRSLRDRLNAGDITFSKICQQLDVALSVADIAYASHWITPREEKRRFDTRFFAAHIPSDAALLHDGAELVSSRWLKPASALEAGEKREIMLIPPTIANLKAVSQGSDAASVLAHVRGLEKPAIMPKIRMDSSGDPKKMQIVMPWEKGYDEL